MIITLTILAITIILFIHGKIRSDLVAVCALVALLLFDILTPAEALAGFSNSIVIMMIGLFVIGGAIFQTGLAKMISNKMLALAGQNQFRLFILVMLSTSLIGAFVSNTGTVALMLPVVVSLAMSAKISPSRLLMPLAFASSMGGMLTLIGTPPNLVINNLLVDSGYESLSFFSFFPIGVICIILGIILLWPLSKWFLSKKNNSKDDDDKDKSLQDLASEYKLIKNLYRVRVSQNSEIAGKRLQDLNIAQRYNINILEIRRRSEQYRFNKVVFQVQAGPETVIEETDTLYTMGDFGAVKNFVRENNLEWLDASEVEDVAPQFSGELRFDEIGIAEVVIMSNSKLVDHTIMSSGFRENYSLNILGIQRSNKHILRNLKDEKIHSGDVLLVQGEWNSINRLRIQESEMVVVGQPLTDVPKASLTNKAPLAAGILVAMVLAMSFNILPPVVAVMAAATLMVLTGCLHGVEDAYQTINWQSIVLIAAMLPMSDALQKTGVSEMVSNVLVNHLGSYGPRTVLTGIYFTTSIMTLFISNTATAVLIAPIALSAAISLGVDPLPFLFAVAVAASMCFASPFSTPPNALVMSAGQYTFMDYVKVGLPMQIIYGIVMVFVLPLLFSF